MVATECAAGYEDHQWSSRRFFVVDMNADFGFSGGPCFDKSGNIKGMLCAAFNTPFSWVLKSTFIVDAFDRLFVLPKITKRKFT